MNLLFRTFLIVLSLAAVVITSAAQNKKPLDPIYDKAKDETTFFLSPWLTVRLNKNLIVGQPYVGVSRVLPVDVVNMVVYVKQPGKGWKRPNDITLAFRSGTPESFRLDRKRTLVLKTQTSELTFGPMTVTEQRRDAESMGLNTLYFWETVELSVKTSDYEKLIAAEKIDGKIGDVDFVLSKAQLKILREIANKHLN